MKYAYIRVSTTKQDYERQEYALRECGVPKAKPRKTRLHSDKVAKFNNPDLTSAYDKAFKAYCA